MSQHRKAAVKVKRKHWGKWADHKAAVKAHRHAAKKAKRARRRLDKIIVAQETAASE